MDKNISIIDQNKCQVFDLEKLGEQVGNKDMVKLPIHHRFRLVLRRSFSPSAKRKLKEYLNFLANIISRFTKNNQVSSVNLIDVEPIKFNPGDRVLVKSKDQIQVTLNHWDELKGCSFLPEMRQYCGTAQKVLKPVTRFVDERDYRVKKVRGVYLLEGINCQGFELYGRCDRACFYFWREEWLEKLVQDG